ncbi:MAG: DUF2299 family protein [Candidatus Odinarchaeota archaeon]
MTDQDFTNTEWLSNLVKEYLGKARVQFRELDPIPGHIAFQFTVDHELSKLKIIIGQTRTHPHQVDVVSFVSFSPVHVEALEILTPDEKSPLIHSLSVWLTPREPEFMLNLSSEDPKQPPSYIVTLSIYEGGLSLDTLMKSMSLVLKSSAIARRVIQEHLNKPEIRERVLKTKEVEKETSGEEEK